MNQTICFAVSGTCFSLPKKYFSSHRYSPVQGFTHSGMCLLKTPLCTFVNKWTYRIFIFSQKLLSHHPRAYAMFSFITLTHKQTVTKQHVLQLSHLVSERCWAENGKEKNVMKGILLGPNCEGWVILLLWARKEQTPYKQNHSKWNRISLTREPNSQLIECEGDAKLEKKTAWDETKLHLLGLGTFYILCLGNTEWAN